MNEKLLNEEIAKLSQEIMKFIKNHKHSISIPALTICLITGYITCGMGKKEFLEVMAEGFDILLIEKVKRNDN
jgi:hypothetical protein